MSYNAGDILFYHMKHGSVEDNAIRIVTRSNYVHVAIALSETQKIEATNNGIVINDVLLPPPDAKWQLSTSCDMQDEQEVKNINAALEWLKAQAGKKYSYVDVLNAALEILHFKFSVIVNDNFDCSALATEFLMKCSGITTLEEITNPHDISPGKLASILGVE